jgi:gliding motility-associated-like protein
MPTTYPGGLELKAPDTFITSVCGLITHPNIRESNARPVFRFDYSDAPYLPYNYIWTPGQYLSDSTSKNPLSYIPKTAQYKIQTVGNSGCIITDSIKVIVPVHDFSVWPKDTSICFGEKAPLEIRKGTYYQWFEYENGEYKTAHLSLSCDYCANPIAKPLKTTHYKIKVGDDLFCYDTIDAYIEVRPLPNIKVLNKDTVIKYGQSVQLMVNGARLYNWTPVSSLNNPNISYPIATPSEPTMYVAEGIGTNGCRASDTVRVGLDYRDNLFIPTAFSPNGDGKNDVFKVSNMTFQRFVEFRVFNRWGQEIYNGGGGDPRKGWDGNWKGVAQESGTYQYLIRVASPDGYVETYKGDVTLVR